MRTSQLHIDFLCRLLGESLFPMLLVDHSGTNRREKTITDSLTSRLHTFGGAFPQAMFWKVYTGEIHSFSRVSWLSKRVLTSKIRKTSVSPGNVRLHGFSSQQLTCSLRVFQWLSATIWITWFGWYNWQRQIKLFGWRRAIFVCPWAVAALCAGILLSFREPHFTFQE